MDNKFLEWKLQLENDYIEVTNPNIPENILKILNKIKKIKYLSHKQIVEYMPILLLLMQSDMLGQSKINKNFDLAIKKKQIENDTGLSIFNINEFKDLINTHKVLNKYHTIFEIYKPIKFYKKNINYSDDYYILTKIDNSYYHLVLLEKLICCTTLLLKIKN